MATINLQQTDTSKTVQIGCSGSSLTGGDSVAVECVSGGAAGTVEIRPALVNSETLVVAYNDISGEIGETTWASGNYTWRLNITTTSSVVTLEQVYLCRLNTAEVSQETLGSVTGLGQSLGTTGVISGTISGSAATSPLVTDKLALIFIFSNTSSHGGNDAVGFTPSEIINTPIEGGVAPITGTGVLDSQSATMSGTAERELTSTGALVSQSATMSGTAERELTGSGSLISQSSTMAGTATVGNAVTGSGALASQSSTMSGTAEIEKTSSGSLVSQSATMSGTAEVTKTGSGSLISQSATMSGTAEITKTSSGSLVSQNSIMSGTASVEGAISGSGVLISQSATMGGAAEINKTASGALIAQNATMNGSGTVSGDDFKPCRAFGANQIL